jgi:hypothetical protein
MSIAVSAADAATARKRPVNTTETTVTQTQAEPATNSNSHVQSPYTAEAGNYPQWAQEALAKDSGGE